MDVYTAGPVKRGGGGTEGSATLPGANGGTGINGSLAANGTLLVGNGAGYTLANLTGGTGISIANGAGSITVNNTGVTSVGLALPAIFTVSGSPVTTTGTLTGTLANETANTIFAGPGTGVPAAPTFRALVLADLPGSGAITVTGGTGLGVAGSPVSLGGTVTLSNTGVTSNVAGTGISVSGGTGAVTINNTGVTSVGLALPAIFTVSGSPVTTTGTLTGTLANETANLIFAGPASGV